MTVALLALNRYVEMRSPWLADVLFRGQRCWLWLLGPLFYGLLGTTSWDLPLIYNTEWSVYLFQINMEEGSAVVGHWGGASEICRDF